MGNAINKKKILVVDDEPNVRQLLRRMLGKNYEVFEAADGEEAVDMAKSKKPDVVLMDMMMPKMDGFAACYAIKKDDKNIQVFILTAIAAEGNKMLAQEVWGADGYLTKPVDIQEIRSTITRSLRAG